MDASKALAAIAIVVAGGVAAFAVYTLGWRDDDEDDDRPATAVAATTTPHVYTLRRGDAVRFPGAATRCVASAEGGVPNLFCKRAPEGLYQVVFFSDRVDVFKNGEPDDPALSAPWKR